MCCEIFVVIIVGYKKNRTKKGSAGSLPSAADGKEPLPSAARKQTAKQLFTVAFFTGAFCRPRLTAKVFAVRLSSLCRPPWQTAK